MCFGVDSSTLIQQTSLIRFLDRSHGIIPNLSSCAFCSFAARRFKTRGGDQVQQVYLHRGRVSGEVEFRRESSGELGHDGGGVVWKRHG